jgi:transposase
MSAEDRHAHRPGHARPLSETAGKRAAAIMIPQATAKANGHRPHVWLTDVLTRLQTTLDKDIGEQLLHRWTLK